MMRSHGTVELPAGSLRPVGFEKDEAIIPFPRRSFTGYRLLQEYFAFPEKFFFLDLSGLDVLASDIFTTKAEMIFLISPFERADRQQSLELNVSERTFKLACSPIINLFEQTAEPVLLEQTKFEYPVIPDARRRNALRDLLDRRRNDGKPRSARGDSLRAVLWQPSWTHGESTDLLACQPAAVDARQR